MIGETVTLLVTGTEKDAENNDRPLTTPVDVPGCVVYPRGSTEVLTSEDLVTDQLTVLLPAGTVVKPTDKMTVRGDDYTVDGTSFAWQSPFTTWSPGVEVNVTKVTG